MNYTQNQETGAIGTSTLTVISSSCANKKVNLCCYVDLKKYKRRTHYITGIKTIYGATQNQEMEANGTSTPTVISNSCTNKQVSLCLSIEFVSNKKRI